LLPLQVLRKPSGLCPATIQNTWLSQSWDLPPFKCEMLGGLSIAGIS
jgi:hypothetical protein